MSEEQYLAEMQEMEDIDELEYGVFSLPPSEASIRGRGRARQTAGSPGILARIESSFVHEEFDPQIEEQEKALSRIEQDEAQAAPHQHAELMRREEGSWFRQFMSNTMSRGARQQGDYQLPSHPPMRLKYASMVRAIGPS